MKIIINLFCLAAMLFIFDSCTVTKRHFGGGYHVEWKKKWNEEDGSVAKKQDAVSDTVYAQTIPVSKSDSEKSSPKKETKVSTSGPSTEEEGKANEEPVNVESAKQDQANSQDRVVTEDETVQEVKTTSSTDEKPTDSGPKKRVEPLTWVAFAFLLAGIGVGLLPAAWFSSVTIIAVVFALLLLIAFINAVSSAMRVKRNPDKYKAKPFTWLMVFFCSLAFAFAFVFLIIYALYPAP